MGSIEDARAAKAKKQLKKDEEKYESVLNEMIADGDIATDEEKAMAESLKGKILTWPEGEARLASIRGEQGAAVIAMLTALNLDDESRRRLNTLSRNFNRDTTKRLKDLIKVIVYIVVCRGENLPLRDP